MIKPVIAYPGAKHRFYPYMVDYFPTDMKVFIEPFLGGGSVSLNVGDDPRFSKLERMVAGDLAPEMWNFWQGIKTNPYGVLEIANKWFKEACPHHETMIEAGMSAELARKYGGKTGKDYLNDENLSDFEKAEITEKMQVHDLAMGEAEKFWNWAEGVDTSNMTIEQRAARMLLVNKISFSGMGDSGSLSRDRYSAFRLDNLESKIMPAHKILQRMEIYNASFEETMKIGNDDPNNSFIFLDPPYYAQEGSGLYGRKGDMHKGFNHQGFADYTMAMKCKWFVTYDDSVYVRRMFKGVTALGTKCNIVPFKIPGGYTMATQNSENALDGEELFIMNYDLDSYDSLDDIFG